MNNDLRMHVYIVVENYLESRRIHKNFDLWDNCIFKLLDDDVITEEQAHFAYEDQYLNDLVEYYKESDEIVLNIDNRKREEEKWYWKQIL